ncbi:MAG: SGNH/GDSL hydrolase family protein [Planctomycetaceae bacterium]
MSRSGKLFTAMFFIMASAAGASAAEPDAPLPRILEELPKPNPIVRIVCFGDSLTGVYYHTGGRRAYADMIGIGLARIQPHARIEMHNAGISGDTTRGALKRIDRDVLAHKPHLVTVMFGMNDMVGVPIDEYKQNLREIVARCRQSRAEVMLCTSNSVQSTDGRPPERLEKYMAALRETGLALGVPIADCYAAFEKARTADPANWALLLSDEIHPNMDGHKLLAETIVQAMGNQSVSLKDVPPPQPAIPQTLKLLESNTPIKVHATPPFDQLIGPALEKIHPGAKVEVTTWNVDRMTIGQLEESAKAIRPAKPDLVIVAVPPSALGGDRFARSLSWVFNYSLSFGHQEWDCIAIPPSVAHPDLPTEQKDWDKLVRRMIFAQDLSGVDRKPGDTRSSAQLLEEWLQSQIDSAVAPRK